MSTRSSISILKKDGSIDSIICHFDGTIRNNGVILFLHYQDKDKINELISHGNLEVLNKKISPINPEAHALNRERDVCYFHARELGSDKDIAHYKDFSDYIKRHPFQDFDYIYNEKKRAWFVLDLNLNLNLNPPGFQQFSLKKLVKQSYKKDEIKSPLVQDLESYLRDEQAKEKYNKIKKEIPKLKQQINIKIKI